eukprot:709188_1
MEDFFIPPATSCDYIIEAITSNESHIDNEKAGDMRQEYLDIVNQQRSFKYKKDQLYSTIVEPVFKSLNLHAISNEFQFEIINKQKQTAKTIHMNSKMITMGRLKENNIVLSDDEMENLQISRMQGYMFVAGDKIVFLDIWSYLGAETIQRSDRNEKCLSTKKYARNILMFNKNEIIHLKMGELIDVLIIPANADKKQLELFPIYKYRQSIKDNINVDAVIYDDEKKQNENIEKLNKKQKEFKEWICELGLGEYYNLFIENGFDDIEVVKLLNDNDLKELGINKKGSRMKILLYSKKGKQNDNEQNEGVVKDSVEQNCST